MNEEPTEGESTDAGSARDADLQAFVSTLLLYVARSDGEIADPETGKMLDLLAQYFRVGNAEALRLLTSAMSRLADGASPGELRQMAPDLSVDEMEDCAVMLLRIVAADGRRKALEVERLRAAGEIMGISEEGMHRAFDRYFASPD